MDVGAWLCGLGLGQYEPAFRENDIDAEVLTDLTAAWEYHAAHSTEIEQSIRENDEA